MGTVGLGPNRVSERRLDEDVARYRRRARASNTLRAYESDWLMFSRWCEGRGYAPESWAPEAVSAEVIARYLANAAERGDGGRRQLAVSTLKRRMYGLGRMCLASGRLDNPVNDRMVLEVMEGIARTRREVPHSKEALRLEELIGIVEGLPATMFGIRDRALLLMLYATGLRRSEASALEWDDIEFQTWRDGAWTEMVVTVRASKTDQVGTGRRIVVRGGKRPGLCPVRALLGWEAACAGRHERVWLGIKYGGKVFAGPLSGHGVSRVVKEAVRRAGYDPAEFSAHSLRRGLATDRLILGDDVLRVMKRLGWQSVASPRRYHSPDEREVYGELGL